MVCDRNQGEEKRTMGIKKLIVLGMLVLGAVMPCWADGLFFEDEPVQDGLPVFDMSDTFAEIYQKLDDVNWAGKNLNVAIESLEGLNKSAHIAATDERVVLVWDDSIIANYPRPEKNDWYGFGEITTALILKMRANDPYLRKMSESEIYQAVVDTLVRGWMKMGDIFSRRRQKLQKMAEF